MVAPAHGAIVSLILIQNAISSLPHATTERPRVHTRCMGMLSPFTGPLLAPLVNSPHKIVLHAQDLPVHTMPLLEECHLKGRALVT